MGALQFAMYTSRFKSIPVGERVHILCNMNDIEDEMHMLCTCTLYHHIWTVMYNNIPHKMLTLVI